MLKELEGYDWEEAFKYATHKTFGYSDYPLPLPAVPEFVADHGIDLTPFTREDVVEIVRQVEGENDAADWELFGRLKDGRWFYLMAGCDYTGWG